MLEGALCCFRRECVLQGIDLLQDACTGCYTAEVEHENCHPESALASQQIRSQSLQAKG